MPQRNVSKIVNNVFRIDRAFLERCSHYYVTQQTQDGDRDMAKVLVLYYSSWGHMEAMANAAAEGAQSRR
jgi:flavorubredoxin